MNQRRWLERLGDAVHAHRAMLVRIAQREGVSGEDALDVVQRAFESVLEADDPERILATDDDARRWLIASTRNLARNHRRLHAHAKPHEADIELADDSSDPETRLLDVETLLRLGNCLKTLAATQRAVVRLRMLEERPGQDVAKELDLAPGHVAVLLHRAKENLQVCMRSQ